MLSDKLRLELEQRPVLLDAERARILAALPHLRGTGRVRQSQARGKRVRRVATRGGKHA